MIACENSGHSVSDDFPEVRKIVEAGAAIKPKNSLWCLTPVYLEATQRVRRAGGARFAPTVAKRRPQVQIRPVYGA